MDAIIYTAKPLTGSLIDAFEYFIAILEHNKDFQFLLVKDRWGYMNGEEFYRVIEERYNLDDIDGRKNIREIKYKKDLLFTRLDKALLIDGGTIPKIKGFLNARRTIIIPEVVNRETYISKRVCNAEYGGEMPFVYKDYDYKMKFLFHRYKNLNKVKKGIFISAPHHNEFGKDEFIKPYLKGNWFAKTPNHKSNLFEKFDTFIYYHSDRYLDPHPRLMHECYFYNKKIIYLNPYKVKDGSGYRYNDLMENGLKGRGLDKNDEVVKEFI